MTGEAQEPVQEIRHNAHLTSSEISSLWKVNSYYSMLRCMYKHFLSNLKDPDLRPYFEFVISMFETRINLASNILKMEGQPVSKGFLDSDIDLAAPRLFTDQFYCYYSLKMARSGLELGALNLSHAIREDVREFYTESVMTTIKFYNDFSKLMLEKGIYVRPPAVNTFKEADTVQKQNFLAGFLGKRRPLLANEVEQLFYGIRNNIFGKALLTGFRQAARSEQLRAYMNRGVEIAGKHVDIFTSALRKEDIQAPMQSEVELVTDSTVPPFSDRLMLQHVTILNRIGITNYAMSMSASLRHDLSLSYTRLIAEVMDYGEDGINIMIDNGWLDEPPRIIDRQEQAGEILH